ncbi:MAG: hypothetical protein ACI9VS_004279, partial [Candidatus Binatia bacterium]
MGDILELTRRASTSTDQSKCKIGHSFPARKELMMWT